MSAAPGTGTAIPARASIRRAGPTAIPSPRSCCRNGTGTSISPPSPTRCAYLNYVADKFDLRRDMQFRCRVVAARFGRGERSLDGHAGKRRAGERAVPVHRARASLGLHAAEHSRPRELSRARPIHTCALAARRRVDFTGKRVGIIGTGATAIQASQTSPSRRSISPSSSARPNWAAPLHNRQDQQGGDGGDQGLATPRSSPAAARPATWFIHQTDPRKTLEVLARGARGVLGEALCASRASASGSAISATS